MKRWTIYCHTHTESGRRYIGITNQTMKKRWSGHVSKSKSTKGGRWHFANAIRKYGPDAFTHEILAQSWDLEGANAIEEALIEQEGTRDPLKGFNLAKGGGSQPHPIRKNPWNDPSFRERVTNGVMKSLQDPLVLKRRAGASVLVRKNPIFRQKMSIISKEVMSRPEVRKKISLSNSESSRQKMTDLIYREKITRRICEAMTPEMRIKIAESSRGRTYSLEIRAKVSAAGRAAMTPEMRIKIAESNRNRKHSSETKAKISSSLKIVWEDVYTDTVKYEKIIKRSREAMTPEHRDRLIELNRNRKHSQETKMKIAESRKGKTLTIETKAKISEAIKSKYERIKFGAS